MRRGVVLPHLVLADEDVTCEPANGWRVVDGSLTATGPVLRDGDLVESWDALKAIQLVRADAAGCSPTLASIQTLPALL